MYLDQHLVSIGLHEDQTTVFCRNNEDVIVKENIWLAHKMGLSVFNDILLYDYYWRLLRNYRIRSLETLYSYGVADERILPIINRMLRWEKIIPLRVLKIGVVSKTLMFLSYLTK